MALVMDIMSQPPATVPLEATVAEAVRCLTEHFVSSLPVVSPQGAVVGIVSEMALLDILFDHEMRDAPVRDYMTSNVHVVPPEESLTAAAHLLALYGIRRLPVVKDGRIVGILSRRELLIHALDSVEPISEPLVKLIPLLALHN
jgi:CBS domain-containing protein